MIDLNIVVTVFCGGIGLVLARRFNNPNNSEAGSGIGMMTIFTVLVYIYKVVG